MLTFVLILGKAASGKTTLAYKFSSWLEKNYACRVFLANFDAGIELLPYKADFDVRDYISIERIMKEEKLGINGAVLKSVELSYDYLDIFLEKVEEGDYEYAFLDVPGMLESLLLSEKTNRIIDRLKERSRAISIFLIDASKIKAAGDYIYEKSSFFITMLKFGLPMLPVFTKAEFQGAKERLKKFEKSKALEKEIEKEASLYSEVASAFAEVLKNLEHGIRFIKVDSEKEKGFEELYSAMHELICACGDIS